MAKTSDGFCSKSLSKNGTGNAAASSTNRTWALTDRVHSSRGVTKRIWPMVEVRFPAFWIGWCPLRFKKLNACLKTASHAYSEGAVT